MDSIFHRYAIAYPGYAHKQNQLNPSIISLLKYHVKLAPHHVSTMKSELKMSLFLQATCIARRHWVKTNEAIVLIVLTSNINYHMKYDSNQFENLHTNEGQGIQCTNKRPKRFIKQNIKSQ